MSVNERVCMMSVSAITSALSLVDQYPLTGPAATTARPKDIWASASASVKPMDVSQQLDISSGGMSMTAAITGVGRRVDISI